MRNQLRKHRLSLLIVGILLLVVLPLAINYTFKMPVFCELLVAEWTAGDALSFYGVLVGVFAAVWGIYLSIEATQDNYRDDIRNRVLPFIALTFLQAKTPGILAVALSKTLKSEDPQSLPNQTNSEYSEYKREKVCFVIEGGSVKAKNRLAEDQERRVQSGGVEWENKSYGKALVNFGLVSAPIEIENVGNGAANTLRIGLNPRAVNDSNYKFITSMPFKVGQKLGIHVYCENLEGSSNGSYDLDIVYEDIYGNRYRQRYDVVISNNKDKERSYIQVATKQEIIGDSKQASKDKPRKRRPSA